MTYIVRASMELWIMWITRIRGLFYKPKKFYTHI